MKQAHFKARCHEAHKPLDILSGVLYGGACAHPLPGYDIYIGLTESYHKPESYPWGPSLQAIHYPIVDMSVPHDVPGFLKMVTWMCGQLAEGKRIHIGCFGGHGRTGLVIAAVVAEALKEPDPIHWVRMNHCHKGVESASQVGLLVKQYGAAPAKATKAAAALHRTYSKPWPPTKSPPRVADLFDDDLLDVSSPKKKKGKGRGPRPLPPALETFHSPSTPDLCLFMGSVDKPNR